ncbi:hypothetical protein GGI59_001688 [Rhizobium lentis]|uniref:Uncharacterized protein n=1 Tax=Rhizobium lentis TaxID=1138194 RepID=A0A7W8UMM5_9HYPH|nr:hypothetical protein [Rhizobium sp. MJ21]MBB4574027.1 hypothetical protein [Rhizobium lentis]MBB5549955.1 hypothetical protein [Rhizobium lentis]MBB5560037.1 hypothetical protein [Rhizobium lentis]MBB5567075.1 hypothetical protein [Rhizobium lentis]MEB3045450.1 hypothetical protein [Rhizobium sp. MJ21]
MTMVGAESRRRGWRGLWLRITGRRGRAEPEAMVEVALRDIDLAAFGGPSAYGLEADRREGRRMRRKPPRGTVCF